MNKPMIDPLNLHKVRGILAKAAQELCNIEKELPPDCVDAYVAHNTQEMLTTMILALHSVADYEFLRDMINRIHTSLMGDENKPPLFSCDNGCIEEGHLVKMIEEYDDITGKK